MFTTKKSLEKQKRLEKRRERRLKNVAEFIKRKYVEINSVYVTLSKRDIGSQGYKTACVYEGNYAGFALFTEEGWHRTILAIHTNVLDIPYPEELVRGERYTLENGFDKIKATEQTD